MKSEYSIKNLLNHSLIFGKLDEKIKLDMFRISCRNNFRYLRSPNRNQIQMLKNILEINMLREDIPTIKIIEKIAIRIPSDGSDFLKKLLEIETLLKSKRYDKWEASTIINICLIRNNFCPLLRFAFDRWYDITPHNSRTLIPYLIEFSTEYLYRLIRVNKIINSGVHLAEGSHNSLFLFKKTKTIKKIPKSIGAKYFINDLEIKITKLLLKSKLKEYIPRLISYNITTKIIIRQYIEGKTGHALLTSDFFNNNAEATKDLKKFFRIYKKIRKKLKINLDIHPGNFVWSINKKKWFFVDTGPIPIIGSEYFPLNSFKNYFQKIWLDRHRRIKELPIRSVDLNF